MNSVLFAYNPGTKPRAAAQTKAFVRYGPGEGSRRYRNLLDLARLALVFASCDLLQLGLEEALKRFQVLDVRNRFGSPGRLGARCVEVLLVVEVPPATPHVC